MQFLGWVSGDDKDKILAEADVFIAPTTYDAMPVSFLEAQAYGLPIVALQWGPVPDIVEDQQTGYLVEGRDPAKLAKALEQLASRSTRQSMGRRAQERVRNNFAIQAVGRDSRSLSHDAAFGLHYGDRTLWLHRV